MISRANPPSGAVVPSAMCHLTANVTPTYKKGQKEDLGSCRLVGLTSVPGKILEQIILSAITQDVQDNLAIRPSQCGIMKDRSCLTNLISFCDKVTQQGMREKLWMLLTWSLVKPLSAFSTSFS